MNTSASLQINKTPIKASYIAVNAPKFCVSLELDRKTIEFK
jgi:hypothetical protein